MHEIRRILCPVDFSDASRHALDHAVVIAGWYGASLTALHVSIPVFLLQPPLLVTELPTAAPTEDDREHLELRLRRWVEPAGATGIATQVLFDERHRPATSILTCAASLPADLIVMGTHGRGGFERLVLGSVTEKVLRKATCPVLTVPPPVVRATKPPFKRLLCPVDFSEPSIAALRFAVSLAEESDAVVTTMHVLAAPVDDERIVNSLDTPEFRLRCEYTARTRLEALIPDEARAFCHPVTQVQWGKPYRRILDVAENEATDLIVMGVHGRNAVELMLFGSTTNQIVRHASCPVLTLRG
jgi:nucleotide-binding universal stress UspA family protein